MYNWIEIATTIPREHFKEETWQEIMSKTHVKAIYFKGGDIIFYRGELI